MVRQYDLFKFHSSFLHFCSRGYGSIFKCSLGNFISGGVATTPKSSNRKIIIRISKKKYPACTAVQIPARSLDGRGSRTHGRAGTGMLLDRQQRIAGFNALCAGAADAIRKAKALSRFSQSHRIGFNRARNTMLSAPKEAIANAWPECASSCSTVPQLADHDEFDTLRPSCSRG